MPPGEKAPSGLYYGNGKLYTVLWPQGTVVFEAGGPGEMRPDGSLAMKFPWWRGMGVAGPLTISGRRLDGSTAPLGAEIPDGYGDTGFQATGIVFPTEGCWEVTGRVGDDTLTFVVAVRKAEGIP